jgi:membrane glycosyltransferase
MSHDVVEAALVRREGWAVHLAPALSGSYEESPQSLVDLATRDRRWCQGNLQHLALLRARGLRPISRLHFLIGIFTYLTSPLWLLFILTGVIASLQARYLPMQEGDAGFALFALPAQDHDRARRLFVVTMLLLVLPKFIALVVLLARRSTRCACGGVVAASASVAIETLVSALIAPVMMLVQSRAVASILGGSDAGWRAQRRDGAVAGREIVNRHLWHTAVGVTLGSAAWLVSPHLFFWMLPIVVGLVLAMGTSALTAQRRVGRMARRIGLFRTPEETAPPPVLAHAAREAAGTA